MRLRPRILQAPSCASKNRFLVKDVNSGGETKPCKRAGVTDFRLRQAKAGQ
jgi:hypothetical protein